MPTELDNKFIRMAIEQARLARENGNMPFGAVLAKDGELVAAGQNQVYSKYDHAYHAELGLIQDYCRSNKILDLSEHTLYSSCEPCTMCACAMIWVRLGRLVYSVSKETLDKHAGKIIDATCHQLFDGSTYKPQVLGGILEDEGEKVLDGYCWG